MKKYISIIIITCVAGLMWSCEKELAHVNTFATTNGMAFVKIVDVAPNFTTVLKGTESFNVYVNGYKINGTAMTYGSVFPVIANLYSAVPAGSQSLRITVNGKITPDSITLTSLNKTLVEGGYYSFFITDSVLSATESKQMWIRDQFALTDTNNFTLRFVDAVLNDPTPVDVYSFRKATNVFQNISPTTATPFVTLPYTILTDTFYVRPTGTLTNIAKITIANGSTTAANRGRPYTLLYYGMSGSTTKPRTLNFFAND